MKFAFVLTNYNNSNLTLKAIHSIAKQNYKFVKIVIIDNASNKLNQKILKTYSKKSNNIKFIFNKKNVGYFKGLNIGINWLRANCKQCQYIIIGNNDVFFPSNFIKSIKNKKNLFNKYPVISPNIKTLDGFYQNPHVISKISIIRELIYDFYYLNYYLSLVLLKISKLTNFFTSRNDEKNFKNAGEIYQGYGALYILGPLFFKNFKNLWAPCFMYYEEFFLSKQLSDKGLKKFYEPSIKVLHRCHSTTKNILPKKKWNIAKKSHKIYRKYISLI